MKYLIVLTFVLVASCGVPQSEHTALQEERDQLQQQLTELEQQKEELSFLSDHSQVTLANTELKELASTTNGQRYTLKIKLPRGYADESASYPVLYVTDAETNFGGISYIVQRLIKDELIPPILVVGIAYDTDYTTFYQLRSRDLTPVEDKELRMGGAAKPDPTGGADKFSDFLSSDLFPFIENNYRVNKEDRAIYGHSYGGLFGSYILLNKPQLFNKYLLLSPSLWYYDDIMLKEATTKNPKFNPTRLYMASGEFEGRIDDLQTEFVAKLHQRKFENLAIESEVMENETHRTIFGAGFTNGMRYLYQK